MDDRTNFVFSVVDMGHPTYTLRQVVAITAPNADAETAARVARQIRHWTSSELLAPASGKSTGTGVSRRYVADEVRKAAILLELAHYRIPAPVLEESFESASEDWPTRAEWHDAVSGRRSIFLYMSFSEHLIFYQLVRSDAVITLLEPKAGGVRDARFETVSAIVINVTRLFARLRF